MSEVTIINLGARELQAMLDRAVQAAVMAAARTSGETMGVRDLAARI